MIDDNDDAATDDDDDDDNDDDSDDDEVDDAVSTRFRVWMYSMTSLIQVWSLFCCTTTARYIQMDPVTWIDVTG